MTNIEILHEIDQSLVAMIKDFSREVNFPELKIIYNEIKFIEKNINNPYSAIIKNNELNILFISQSKILNNIKNELNNYNINSNDKANILKNSLIPNIKQYLNNYNKIWNIMKHKNQNKNKKSKIETKHDSTIHTYETTNKFKI